MSFGRFMEKVKPSQKPDGSARHVHSYSRLVALGLPCSAHELDGRCASLTPEGHLTPDQATLPLRSASLCWNVTEASQLTKFTHRRCRAFVARIRVR